MAEKVFFPFSDVIKLRNSAWKAVSVAESVYRKTFTDSRWRKSVEDPMKLLGVFKSLSLKNGYILRGYQFRAGGNGNGVVWAMPENAPFPEPEECTEFLDNLFSSPKPPQVLENFMDAIQGDGSPLSYISASIFARHIFEFGASWHGESWAYHRILGMDYENRLAIEDGMGFHNSESGNCENNRIMTFSEYIRTSEWEWHEKIDENFNWSPSCLIDGDKRTVVFHTYSGHVRETIIRHIEKYEKGSYNPQFDYKEIVSGPEGFIT